MQVRAYVADHRGKAIAVAIAAVLAVGLGIYWFGPQYLFLDKRLDEALPGAGAGSTDAGSGSVADLAVLAEGGFMSLAHETTGTASLVQLEDGSTIVRFDDLDTLAGPDLRVYLSTAPADGPEDALDDDVVDLGGLKGNQGSQNYAVPDGVDVSKYSSVVIWCRRFSVGFGVAALAQA